jgi:hypothetical protein
MTKEMESPARRRARRLAAYATAVGLGAGIVTGTAVASADTETDAPSNGTDPPSNSTGVLGPTLDTVSNIAKGFNDIPVVKKLDKSTAILGRIVTNHSLVTARPV